ncbi:RNA-dependent RNA polymerase [Nitzschia inconspicua]|uniref:RNA-dependent RNA polymerase n=1 Tax=Nitzschia inconspicua TaxID=303405 RepID=A0A9K3M042_9STRA|nr:RNA-dependent RNA polymerase [Nitzschia inconspicua]
MAKSSAASRFVEYSSQKNVEAALNEHQHKEEQSKYQEMIRTLEADILSRTVFVTNVLDLNQSQNLVKLKLFLEQTYGLVEKCERSYYRGTKVMFNRPYYPPARVRFGSKTVAERVFQGTPLASARSVTVSCSEVGSNGILRIQPSSRYNGITDDVLGGDEIQLDVLNVSMGHWCPNYHDTYMQVSDAYTPKKDIEDVFWEELCIQHGCDTELCMTINLKRRNIEISTKATETDTLNDLFETVVLQCTDLATIKQQSISFRFKELRSHMEVYRDRNFLVFSLKWPPKLYHSTRILENQLRNREVTFLNATSVDFGRCRSFMVELTESNMKKLTYHNAVNKLCKFGVFARDFEVQSSTITARSIANMVPQLHSRLEADMSLMQRSCHPEIGLLAQALVDNAKCDWYSLLEDCVERELPGGGKRRFNLPQIIQSEFSSSPTIASIAIQTLEKFLAMQEGCTSLPCKLFLLLAEDQESGNDLNVGLPIPEHCVRVPRMLLSPCQKRIIEVGTEMSNRVIRKFTKEFHLKPCSFLRLQVGDETGEPLFDDLSPSVHAHITSAVLNGIEVNGRKYRFLAYSSSQLKESSLWMVDSTKCSYDLRSALGDFSSCGTVSKWAARVGQCLSTTVDSTIASAMIIPAIVPDVLSRLRMEHSDGTGIISRDLFNGACKQVPFAPADPNDVSIVQIRLGGAKGTLSAWREEEHIVQEQVRVQRDCIFLRKSMTKFKSPFDRLEVCAVGTTVPYYLNRFIILLLKEHGVPDEVFVSMQSEMIDELDAMLSDRETAMKLLPSLSGPDATLIASLQHMLNGGLSPATEPFLFSALHAIRQHHLFTLRKKARIFVEKGAVLMGGLDESGQLKEGEVFVQFSRSDVSNPGKLLHSIASGKVMVTKHPAMHMGDVRMLRAVNIPGLHDHKNVILFSQHGDRPEADKMSGSDLDGDQFAVTWDERLFLVQGNREPMDFTAPSSTSALKLMPEEANEQDAALIRHFLDHMINDNLGRIATLWLDYASRFGAACENCVQLAKLHSIAVDFPKSGIPAVVPKELHLPAGFQKAHWREVKNKDTVHCESIIGQLYDQVLGRTKNSEAFENHAAIAEREIDSYGRILSYFRSVDEAKASILFNTNLPEMLGFSVLTSAEKEQYIEEADELMKLYNEEVRTMMNKYRLHSEGELFTGCIRKYHKLNKKKQHSIAEEVRRTCRELKQKHRHWFFETVLLFVGPPPHLHELETGDPSQTEKNEDEVVGRVEEVAVCLNATASNGLSAWEIAARRSAFLLAGASYVSVYSPARVDGMERWNRTSALFSFPWLVADVIHAGINDSLNISLKSDI